MSLLFDLVLVLLGKNTEGNCTGKESEKSEDEGSGLGAEAATSVVSGHRESFKKSGSEFKTVENQNE